jgi:hypothetical protein
MHGLYVNGGRKPNSNRTASFYTTSDNHGPYYKTQDEGPRDDISTKSPVL